MPDPVARFLAESSASLRLGPGVDATPGKYDRVAVVVADREQLREYRPPRQVRASAIAILVEHCPGALGLAPRPDWPTLTALRSRRTEGGAWLVLHFARAVPVAEIVAEVGRQSVWPDLTGNRGLFDAADIRSAEKVPPDVVHPRRGTVESEQPSPVTGRTTYLLSDLAGPLAVGQLDERVLNPIGFDASATGAPVDVSAAELGSTRVSELVSRTRALPGVRLALTEGSDTATARAVAGLAMAGIPIVTEAVPDALARLLGEPLAAALTAPADLDDVLVREEQSILQRRAAFDTFSSHRWAQGVAAHVGIRVSAPPSVSVVLATKRPEQLAFALNQVARQRNVEQLQLVLAPHGFAVDEATVRDGVGGGLDVTVVPSPDETLFGDVLARAVDAADGDVVLKMDDDDWYGPEAIADLLRARAYSGADVVGMPAEMHYLAPKDLTVKRGHPCELYERFVAGGTLMIGRSLLRDVGSFRSVRKFVDASLLAAVTRAGGVIFRTHGLGYLLRRNASGHTWEADMDYLLDPSRVQRVWEGLTPSRILELAPDGEPPSAAPEPPHGPAGIAP